jgi:hypothetical protein
LPSKGGDPGKRATLNSRRWFKMKSHMHCMQEVWYKDLHPCILLPRPCVDQPRRPPPLSDPHMGFQVQSMISL